MRFGNRISGLRLRVVLRREVAIGPGKADLLDGIAATGSIAAAGRRLNMSYRRAWGLVESLNSDFDTPLVRTSKGGTGHGGAALTERGQRVLALYRRMEACAADAIATDLETLRSLVPDLDQGEPS